MKKAVKGFLAVLLFAMLFVPPVIVFAANIPNGYVSPAGLYVRYNGSDTTWIPSLYQCDALCFAVDGAESDMLTLEAHHVSDHPLKEIAIADGQSFILKNNFFNKDIDNGTVRIRGTAYDAVTDDDTGSVSGGNGITISFGFDPYKYDYWFELYLSDIRFGSNMIEMHVKGKEYLSSTVYRDNSREETETYEYDIDEDYTAQIMPDVRREKPGEGDDVYFTLYFENKKIAGQYLRVRVKVLAMLPKGVNAEVVETAENTPGETAGTPIPAVIAVGVVAAGAAVLAAAAASGEEKKQGPSFAMKIYKEFGDTIRLGETAAVYARIVEIDGKTEKERPDLTRNINIRCHDGTFRVWPQDGLSGIYKGAAVEVDPEHGDAAEGMIDFEFVGAGGTFTDMVVFRIQEPRIIFYQDNLALVAKDEKGAELGFTVEGLDTEKLKVELRFEGGRSYVAAPVQAVDKELKEPIPGTYFAVIADVNEEEGDPGTYVVHTLRVHAYDGKTSADGKIDVYRVSVGLNVGVSTLNCYRTLKKTAAGKKADELTAADFDISYTQASVMILKVDEEKREMYYKPAAPEITITPLDGSDSLMQERLDGIGIEAVPTEIKDGTTIYTFYCKKGWLEPPLRANVRLHAKAVEIENGVEVEYVCDKAVTLLSQRMREKVTMTDIEGDQRIQAWIDSTQEMIAECCLMDDLGGEYMMLSELWHSYDEQFGYDPILVAQIQSNIENYMHAVKRHALAERQKMLEKMQETANADNNTMTIWSKSFAMISDKYLDTWGGLAGRIALGFCTGGLSEVVFLAMDVNKAVSDYNERTLLCDRTFGGKLFAGSVPVIITVATLGAFKFVGAGSKATWAVTPEPVKRWLKGYAMKATQAVMSRIPESWVYASQRLAEKFKTLADKINSFDPRKRMFNIRKAAAETDALNLKAKSTVRGDIVKVRKTGLSAKGQMLDKVQRVAELKAAAKLERFKKAWNRSLTDKSPAAVKELKDAFSAVEKDTFAIRALNADGKTGAQIAEKIRIPNEYRAAFNECKAGFMDDPAEKIMRRKVAAKYGVSEDEVIIKRATGKTAADLKEGITSPFDSDNSVLIFDRETGKYKYLTQAESDVVVSTSYCEAMGIEYTGIDDAIAKSGEMKVVSVTPTHQEYYMEFDKLKSVEAFSDEAIAHNMKTGEFKMAYEFREANSKWDALMSDKARMQKISSECEKFLNREIADVSDDTMRAVGLTEKMNECCHQVPKTYDLYVPKDINGQAMGASSGYSENSRMFAEACRYADNQGVSNISIGELNDVLELRGTNYSQCCSEMTLEFKTINTSCRTANQKAASALWNTAPGSGADGAVTGAAGAVGGSRE